MIEIEGFYLPGIISIILFFLCEVSEESNSVYFVHFLAAISFIVSFLFYGILFLIWIYNNVRIV